MPILPAVFAVFVGISTVFGASGVAAAPVGTVAKVQNHAQIGTRTATVGAPVHMGDVLRTGAKARLQIAFSDGTTLTLGENARVVIDRYVYNPAQSTGKMALNATQGAVRVATGRLSSMRDRDVTVKTPAAALAVRGTDFWAGPIDGHYGVVLLGNHGATRNKAVQRKRKNW